MLIKTRREVDPSYESPSRRVRCFVWLLAGIGSIVLGVLALYIPPTSVEARQLLAIGIFGAYGVVLLGIGLIAVGIRQWITLARSKMRNPDV